jgi:Rad3-related DNA helicase
MFDDATLASLLPFHTPRGAQIRALRFIADAWGSGKRTIVLDLPTGVGKSGVALAASKLSAMIPVDGRDVPESTWVLTTEKTLQAQYVNDFPGIVASVSSKSNYQCVSYGGDESCDKGTRLAKQVGTRTLAEYAAKLPPGEKGRSKRELVTRLTSMGHTTLPCCNRHLCPYKAAFDTWLKSPVSVTNFAYFLNLMKVPGWCIRRPLLIVDEAHEIEEELVNFHAVEVSSKFLKSDMQMTVPSLKDIAGMRNWLIDDFVPRLSAVRKRLETEVMVSDQTGRESVAAERRLRNIENQLRKAIGFLDDGHSDEWVLCTDASGLQAARPLHTGRIGSDTFLKAGARHLFMSGTILNKHQFCKTIGIDESVAAHYLEASPFDADRRWVVFRNVGSMGRKGIEQSFPSAISNLEMIMERHADEKGIIHTGTYDIAAKIKKQVKSDRFLFHDDARGRQGILEEHALSNRPTILVSPSMTTGVDLKGDLARWGIIFKVPWPYLGDERIKRLCDEDRGWYDWKTVQGIMQQCGRVVRDETDDAVIYILDGDFRMLIKRCGDMFPEWWLEALRLEEIHA